MDIISIVWDAFSTSSGKVHKEVGNGEVKARRYRIPKLLSAHAVPRTASVR